MKRKEDRRFNGAGLPILDSEFVVSLHYRPPVCGLVLPPTGKLSNRLVFCQNLKSPSPIIILLFPRSVTVRPACPKSLPSQMGYISMWREISYPNWTGYQVSPIKFLYTIHLLRNIPTEITTMLFLYRLTYNHLLPHYSGYYATLPAMYLMRIV